MKRDPPCVDSRDGGGQGNVSVCPLGEAVPTGFKRKPQTAKPRSFQQGGVALPKGEKNEGGGKGGKKGEKSKRHD